MFCSEMDGIDSLHDIVIILASNRADLISAGDALVAIDVPDGDADTLFLTADLVDVTVGGCRLSPVSRRRSLGAWARSRCQSRLLITSGQKSGSR